MALGSSRRRVVRELVQGFDCRGEGSVGGDRIDRSGVEGYNLSRLPSASSRY